MKFISTRGKWDVISSSTAIIKGIADDGGLYVPISFPSLYEVLKEKNIKIKLFTRKKQLYIIGIHGKIFLW